jgi:AraC family transcriptional activator FtrA
MSNFLPSLGGDERHRSDESAQTGEGLQRALGFQDSAQVSPQGPLVLALVYDGLCTFEFSIVAEVFGLSRPEMGPHWYRFEAFALDSGPCRAQGGLTFTAPARAQAWHEADVIVVPGWKGVDVPVPKGLAQALRAAHARGATVASICSGAFVLAAAGLLDGRRAATHWRYAQALAQRHPQVQVDDRVLYAGEGRIYTSAGSAAGIDLLLALVRERWGSAGAARVARRLVMPPHREGGQAQFIEHAVPTDLQTRLTRLTESVRQDLGRPWSVASLAAAVAMSPRNFARRFQSLMGEPPMAWLQRQRVDQACLLLETTRLGVEQVAAAAGFATVAALRRQMDLHRQTTPSAYRLAQRRGPGLP